MLKSTALILMTVFSISIYADSAHVEKVNSTFIGYAYDLETKDLLYSEHHSYQTAYHHKVQYKEADGEVFANKEIDYQNSYFAPDFTQNNLRNGEVIKTKKDRNKIIIQYKEDADTELEKDRVAYSSKLIIDAGFDHFISKNWQELNTGKELTIDYLIPSLLDHYELTVKKENCKNENQYCYSISASSFFISLFSSKLKLTYSKTNNNDSGLETIRLASFQGRSNICDSEGNYQDVKITYEYQ